MAEETKPEPTPEGITRIEVEDEGPEAYDRFYVANKDPNFAYRWCNVNERAMNLRRFEGWTPAPDDGTVPPEISAMGQQISNPAGGTVQQRGDVMLMRMPRDRFDRKVRKKKAEARERQAATVDTLIQQANEDVKARLRQHYGDGGSHVRAQHVFATSPDNKFAP